MTTAPFPGVPRRVARRRPLPPLIPAHSGLLLLGGLTTFVSVIWLYFFAAENPRSIFGPVLAIGHIALFHIGIVYRRDGRLPIFDIGTFLVLAATVYTTVPLIGYALGGYYWGGLADNRLRFWYSSPQIIGAFAWRPVLYLATFSVVYLLFRLPKTAPPRPLEPIPRATRIAVVVAFLIASGYTTALALYVYLPGASSYGGLAATDVMRNVPHIFRQIFNILYNAEFVLKLWLAVILLASWQKRWARFTLVAWLLIEFTRTAVVLQSRAQLVLLLLAVAVMYHRIVRPIRLVPAVTGGTLLLAAFLLHGALRDIGATRMSNSAHLSPYTTVNEFQVLFANAYDVHMRKQMLVLPDPPPQLPYSDLYMLIPRQLLPFEKWDPAEWYAEVLGLRDTTSRVMWGIMAQAVLGRDWIDLILHGAMLATFYGIVFRWYSRHSQRLWPTLAYLFLLLWAYYSFRATTFFVVYMFCYYFIPAFVAVVVLARLLVHGARIRRRVRSA